MELKQSLVQELTESPGQKASQLAVKLNSDRREINQLLHNQLRHQFEQDTTYKWWPVDRVPRQKKEEPDPGFSDTSLARLCRYYLACLGQDDLAEVSTWARSQYNYDYVALNEVPLDGINGLLQEPNSASLLKSMQRDRSTKVLYLGYPICIHRFMSKRGEPIYRLEPVLFLPVQFEHPNNRGTASVLSDYPMINTAVLKRYSNADRDTLMDELVQLEKELGFANTVGELPELDEVAQRLYAIRKDWPWHEACVGAVLPDAPPVHKLDEAGLYNRAVLVSADRKPYTQGLENELRELGKLNGSAYEDTILGKLVNNCIPKSQQAVNETLPLLEVLPMNTEQRQAIQRSLVEPLTIITGPPGTGKSQVVTDLLVNAAWQGKKILFASKNNKAVDVVETRVNSLGPRPILLRMGSSEYQQKLSDYVQELLSATAGPEQEQDYQDALADHHKLVKKMEENSAALEQVIDLRNKVDGLEQSVEYLRPILGTKLFQAIKNFPSKDWEYDFSGFFDALSRAEKSKQKFFDRLMWMFIKKSRILQLVNEVNLLNEPLADIGLSLPVEMTEESGLQQYLQFENQVKKRLAEIKKVSDYFQVLQDLQTGESLESLNQKHRQLLSEIADNSSRLWGCWLKVHAAKLNTENRRLLSQYAAAIKMIIDSRGGRVTKTVWRKYYSLSEKVSQLLPCWAVTSLSARGKLPFTAGYYDLVVFDEASQCDIASALPLLYRAKHAVIIGDRQQLSHISRIQKRQDQQLLERFDLVGDYLQWAYATNSLFEMAQSYADREDIVDLKDHHRSHADIINFSNRFFYDGRLRIATRYDRLKSLGSNQHSEPGVRWVDIKGQTIRPNTGSAVNIKEAEAVLSELKRLLLEQKYQGTIGVVSPFRAQANFIKELCNKSDELEHLLDDAEFLSDTVHRFQGDERDLMIFSPVISKGTASQSLNFLKNNRNLFNVAITRARAMLLVIGDRMITRTCGVDYLEKFSHYVDQLDQASITTSVREEAREYGPKYPESIDRSRVSDWEVIFYEALYNAGIKSVPQYPIEQYVLDFAVLKDDRKLNIEVDGERYHRNWTGELCRRDQIRNQRLYELGWDVLRFWVYEVRDELDNCVHKVRTWIEKS